MRRAALGFLAFLALLMLAHVRLHDTGPVRALDYATFDLRLKLRPALGPGDEVAIVVIDDASLQRLGHWPPPRAALAAAFEALAAAGASVVAVDLLLLEPTTAAGGPEDAQALVHAIMRKSNIVLAMAFGFAAKVEMDLADKLALGHEAVPIARTTPEAVDLLGEPAGVFLPFRPLAEHARLGHVNVFVEPAGELRYIHPVIRFEEAWYPALALQAVALHRGLAAEAIIFTEGQRLVLGEVTAPLDTASRLVINPYGPPGTFPHISLVDLLDGRLEPGVLDDKVVLVGATATGVRDRFGTAFHPQVAGVEIFANVVDNLLTGRFIDRGADVRTLELGLIVASATTALALLLPLPLPLLAVLAVVVVLLPFAMATLALLGFGLWLDMVVATLGCLVVASLAFAVRFRRMRLRGLALEHRSHELERYVSPVLRARLASEGLAERDQLAAILFCDLEGFTSAAETVAPDQLQLILQRFYALIETTATAHGAVVAGYAGDGAMLILGLPDPAPEDPLNAIRCGTALLAAMPGWQTAARQAGLGSLDLRIGINYGRVRIGHVGGGDQIQLTATGDVVNVAARLQEQTRVENVPMLVSATTVEAARAHAGDRVVRHLTPLPPMQLRGRQEAVPVYALGPASENHD